ncbi:MAG: hypothetical protein MI865_09600 [Proteobacteria bacterium]|nr:hypothetical protein [Pseudomonadota bacterium]
MDNYPKTKTDATRLTISIVMLAIINVFIAGGLFSFMHQFDYSQLPVWAGYLFSFACIIFCPILLLIGQIDSFIRIQDYWYYVGAVINSIIWAIIIIYIARKNNYINTFYNKT